MLVRRCLWAGTFVFIFVALATGPWGLGKIPARGPDLWGYLVVSGEFRWVFVGAVAIAAALSVIALLFDRMIAQHFRYDPLESDIRDGE
jgi:hypothetical protein